MNVLHLRITEPQKGNWQLKSWASDPLQAKERPIDAQGIKKLTAMASTEYYVGSARPEIGRELFRLLDGAERLLTNAIHDAEQSPELLVLAIDARADLAFLPWEIMADENGFLVERENPRIVPARWESDVGKAATWPAPKRRPLRALFMAAAPTNGGQPLDYDAEEGRMTSLRSHMGDQLLNLTVEETGCLTDLRSLVDYYGENTFDVFHLTGHAGFTEANKPVPVFHLENEVGELVKATASDLLIALAHRPQLVFLSGCNTARSVLEGAEHSMAGSMVRGGIPAVLGWGRKVGDAGATKAAEILYRELAHGHSVPSALSFTWRELIRTKEPDWHHLRLHFAGAAPGPLVTAPSTWEATAAVPPRSSERFLIPGELRTKVPGPMEFVGRRRQIQECLRILRSKDHAGVILHGTGGLGKSSITARLADRLGDTYRMAAVFGEATEDRLINALNELLSEESLARLRGVGDLRSRLSAAISTCPHRILFVLDDYERNQANPADSTEIGQLNPEAASVLRALADAVGASGLRARLIISSRYIPPIDLMPRVIVMTLKPCTAADEEKRIARLLAAYPTAAQRPDALLQHARCASGGNHRLLEWLFEAMADSTVIDEALLTRLEAENERFRADLLARELCAALTPAARDLLTALQVCEEPVPLAAALALHTGPQSPATESAVAAHLATAAAWGLAYVWQIKGQPHWLAAPFLRPILGEPPAEAAPAVLPVLQKHWRDDLGGKTTESRLLELRRLAFAAGDHPLACEYAYRVCSVRLFNSRSREAAALAASTLDAIQPQRDPRLVRDLARALQVLGEGEASAALFAEAAALHGDHDMDDEKAATLFTHSGLLLQQGKVEQAERICRDQLLPFFTDKGEVGLYRRAVTLEKIADILGDRGELDEALRIRREQVLPVFEKLGDERSRAITLGRICDILSARGELDEALRIRREELLPVFEKLGDERSCAMTLGKIAGILTDRGELDEALRIRREEQLPVFEKLGDVRTRALTQGKIADILSARGELDEALHIHREEVLPVFEKLGDVRSRAVTMGQIADILGDRGELDEALRIRREEMIPVFEKIGEVRDRAVTLGKIADILSARGELDEALRIRREEELPVFVKLGDVRERAVTLGKIADILSARGQLDEALRIRREEVLPVYEKLGEVRSRALTLAQIADIFRVCGQLDEALFMLREEVLPIFEKLRDVRFRAMALGKIADILRARGQLEEALRIRREEELPVYEKLGDVRSLIAGRVMVAQMLVIRGNKEDVMEIVTHLAWAWREARRMGLPEAGRIEEIATSMGLPVEALAQAAEKV